MSEAERQRITGIRAQLKAAVSVPEDQVDLARAALLIAQEQYPNLDIPAYLKRLDELASAAGDAVGETPVSDYDVLIRSAHRFLFAEAGFSGNAANYYDARNSFLNDVIDRRTGIPITLAIVYMEIAKRRQWPVVPVGFPGHFLVKWEIEEREIIVDPFHGVILSDEDCRELLKRVSEGRMEFDPALLSTLPSNKILSRILTNLKVVWMHQGDFMKSITACDRILLIDPEAHSELRDRGLLWAQLDCHRPALIDLEQYVERVPDAVNVPAVMNQLTKLRRMVEQIS